MIPRSGSATALAAQKRATEGCALFWFDLLFLSLPRPLQQQQQQQHRHRHRRDSGKPSFEKNPTAPPSQEVQDRWWPPTCTADSWAEQPEAATVARVAVAMLFPEDVWRSCGAVMRSAGFAFPSSSSSSSNNKTSGETRVVRVPAAYLVTTLELLCRRFTDDVPSERERLSLRQAFWRTAAFVSFRAVELEPPDVARALSVMCEVPPAFGWDTPVMHKVERSSPQSTSSSASSASSSASAITPRGICAYLSCQARLRARRFNAILSLHALSSIGGCEAVPFDALNNSSGSKTAGATGGGTLCDPRDIAALQRKVLHDCRDRKWRPIAAQALEASCAVLGDDAATMRSSSSNLREVLQFATQKELPQTGSTAASATVPWALLPCHALNGLSWWPAAEAEPKSGKKQQQPQQQHRRHQDSRRDSAEHRRAVDGSLEHDVVGRAMLRQLVLRRPLQPPMMMVSSSPPASASSTARQTVQHRRVFAASVRELNMRDLEFVRLRKAQDVRAAATAKPATEFGPAQRRRALIARAEQLLMFHPTLTPAATAATSSSSVHFGAMPTRTQIATARTHMAAKYEARNKTRRAQKHQRDVAAAAASDVATTTTAIVVTAPAASKTKSARAIWGTVHVWSDVFEQLSPQAKRAITSAAIATFRGAAATSSDALDSPVTLRTVAESVCCSHAHGVVPELVRGLSRAALHGMVGYRYISGRLAHLAAALSQTVNGLGVADIVPRLALTSCMPREALALCAARLVGSAASEDVVPCFELHTQGCISPSGALLATLRMLLSFNAGDARLAYHYAMLTNRQQQQHGNAARQQSDDGDGDAAADDDGNDDDDRTLRKHVVAASAKLMLDAVWHLVGGSNSSSSSTSAAAGTRRLLSRQCSVPLLCSTAIGSSVQALSYSLMERDGGSGGGSNTRSSETRALSARVLQLAMLQSTLISARLDAFGASTPAILTLAEEGGAGDSLVADRFLRQFETAASSVHQQRQLVVLDSAASPLLRAAFADSGVGAAAAVKQHVAMPEKAPADKRSADVQSLASLGLM